MRYIKIYWVYYDPGNPARIALFFEMDQNGAAEVIDLVGPAHSRYRRVMTRATTLRPEDDCIGEIDTETVGYVWDRYFPRVFGLCLRVPPPRGPPNLDLPNLSYMKDVEAALEGSGHLVQETDLRINLG